jgi:glycosyltransferase involved in cell wall biosynthesis
MSRPDGTPPRVAFVLGQHGRGGTESQSELLVRGLRSRGIAVDVFILEGGPDPDRRPGFGDAPVTRLGPGRGNGIRNPLMLCVAGTRLGRALRRRRYDVVHAALARAYLAAPLAAPWRRRPRIVAWRRNTGCHLGTHRGAAIVDAIAGRLSDIVVANAASVRQYWIARGIPADRMRVIPNALEPWRFEPAPRLAQNGVALRLVTVGSLLAVKGHDVLLEAAARLRLQGDLVEVVILGEGPCRDALREQANRLGVPLLLPGHVADPRPWLASAGVYVHPSRSEGASNAIAEAMAQGCAVLSTDVGGAAEMLGPHGVLVPPEDPVALAEGLRRLLGEPARRREMGVGARDRAHSRFSLDRVIDLHLEIYARG